MRGTCNVPTKHTNIDENQFDCLSALADHQRVRIMAVLSAGEHCVCELTELLGLRQNTLSHHLKVLREQELILTRRKPSDQRWIYYRLNPAKLRGVVGMLTDWAIRAEAAEPRDPVCPITEPTGSRSDRENRSGFEKMNGYKRI